MTWILSQGLSDSCQPTTRHNHKHAHTLIHTYSYPSDNLVMPVSLHYLFLDWRRKREYPEETPKHREPNSFIAYLLIYLISQAAVSVYHCIPRNVIIDTATTSQLCQSSSLDPSQCYTRRYGSLGNHTAKMLAWHLVEEDRLLNEEWSPQEQLDGFSLMVLAEVRKVKGSCHPSWFPMYSFWWHSDSMIDVQRKGGKEEWRRMDWERQHFFFPTG